MVAWSRQQLERMDIAQKHDTQNEMVVRLSYEECTGNFGDDAFENIKADIQGQLGGNGFTIGEKIDVLVDH